MHVARGVIATVVACGSRDVDIREVSNPQPSKTVAYNVVDYKPHNKQPNLRMRRLPSALERRA